jgi:hypothetical protein
VSIVDRVGGETTRADESARAAGAGDDIRDVANERDPVVSFTGILFGPGTGVGASPLVHRVPDHFGDLNLDQVVEDITAGREQYDLAPFFFTPLRDAETVAYRQDVMRDLEARGVSVAIDDFASRMTQVRNDVALAARLRYPRQSQRVFLDAVGHYLDAVTGFDRELAAANLHSGGLVAFRDYLTSTVQSPAFAALVSETTALIARLSAVRYCLHLQGNRITVTPYAAESDYGAEVERTFARFRQGDVDSHLTRFPESLEMNHVEAGILDLVAELFPAEFTELEDFSRRHGEFVDPTIATFDREVQFYAAYHEFLARFGTHLAFCYPTVSERSREVSAVGVFDLALATKLLGSGSSALETIVTNDFSLRGRERILVVSGANQGGKTTFARAFGQVHYLASLGLPVPGSDVTVDLFDRLFTHFEKEEDLHTLSGKLGDDLTRIRDILNQATDRSILIMNEIFTSTSLEDAVFLGTEVIRRVVALDLVCVCVTFVDELATLSDTAVSMVATVDPDDPVERTFRILRRPADGLAYASALAGKYGLGFTDITERIAK